MYLEQAVQPQNKFWKYLLGVAIIFLASTIGQLPLVMAITYSSVAQGKSYPATHNQMMQLMDSNLTLFLMLISFVVALLAAFWVFRQFHKQTIISVTTAREKIDWGRIRFSFTVWAIFSAGSTLLLYLVKPENFQINFQLFPFLILVVIGILLIPIQTSFEEYVFRGYLMQGFAVLAKNRWVPLLMTSLIFGALHIANPEVDKLGNIIMVYYIGTGLFLGIVTLMDEGIELALGFHAANNLIGAILVTSEWSAFQTYSIFKDVSNPNTLWDVLIPVFSIFPLLLFIFNKKYGWNDWKDKLFGELKA